MAQETTQRQITFLTQELDILQNESENLKNCIDIFSTMVINEAKVWIDGQERNKVKFSYLLQKVQEATVLIAEKSKEINDFSELQDVTALTGKPSPSKNSASVATDIPGALNKQTPNITESSSRENKEIQKYLARLEILEEAFSSLKCGTQKVEGKQEQFDEWIETAVDKSTNHDKVIGELSNKFSTFIKTYEKQLKAQEKEIQNLSGAVKDVRSQNGSKYNEIMTEMSAASDFMESMKENFDSLSSQVEEHVLKLNTVESDQLHLTTTLADQEINLTSLKTELKDVNDKFGEICLIVTKRLKPLAAVQEVLYNKKTSIEENKSKLSSLEMKMSDLSKTISQTKNQESFAFSATTWEKQMLDSDGQDFKIKKFSNISGNAGNSFDPLTGEFTAPCSGLYFITLTLKNMNEFSILGQMLIHDPKTQETRGGFCCIERLLPQMSQCTATIVDMEEGEKLFISLLKINDKTHTLDMRMKLTLLLYRRLLRPMLIFGLCLVLHLYRIIQKKFV